MSLTSKARLFVAAPLGVGQAVPLPPAAARHALRALRLRAGERVTLFNGQGGEYQGVLVHEAAATVTVEIDTFLEREAELPYAVTVAQGLPEGDKMDWIVEKAAELGANRLVPLELARSVVRLTGERAQRRRERWQQVAQAAAEQCGRNRILAVEPVASLSDWLGPLQNAGAAGRYVLLPGPGKPLRDLPRALPGDEIILAVGPEGGFTAEEVKQLQGAHFVAVTLGERVLRTETAGLAALSGLAALWS